MTDSKITETIERLKLDYEPRYKAHWAHFEAAGRATLSPLERELWQNGFVRIDGAISAAEIAAANAELAKLPGLLTGDYAGDIPYTAFRDDGIAALEVADRVPVCYDILKRKDYLGAGRTLYGPDIKNTSRTVSIKYKQGNHDSSNVPHWDDWAPRLKMFLYLTDVTQDCAPTIYMRGSNHRDKPSFRFNKDFANQFLPGATYGGSWVPFYRDDKFDAVSFLGNAGTAYLFDARGVHAGSALNRGPRVMLTHLYMQADYTFRPY